MLLYHFVALTIHQSVLLIISIVSFGQPWTEPLDWDKRAHCAQAHLIPAHSGLFQPKYFSNNLGPSGPEWVPGGL